MRLSTLQYHATPAEQIEFLKECIANFPIICIAVSDSNSFAEFVNLDNLNKILSHNTEISKLFIFLRSNIADSAYSYLSNEANSLHFVLARLGVNRNGKQCLHESSIGSLSEDEDCIKMWRKIYNVIKKNTRTGGKLRSVKNGVVVAAPKTHRYTSGAIELYQKGIVIEPFGNLGAAEYILV